MAETRRIKRLEQSDPVHAECDVPRFTMRRIVGIEFGRAQSVSMDEIHLAADIDFGAINIKIGDETYSLSLASALVLLEKENANVVTGSKYSHVLSKGEVSTSAAEKQSSARSGSVEVSGAANLLTGLTSKIGGAFNKSGNKAAEASSVISHRINFVTPEGQDGWRIGGANGDPRLASNDLRGAFIDPHGDGAANPLCTLEAIDTDTPVSGRIRVQASLDDFRLRGRQREKEALETIGEGLEADKPEFVARETEAEAELRERVATMALLLPKRREADEALLDIAARSFTFTPEIETDELR